MKGTAHAVFFYTPPPIPKRKLPATYAPTGIYYYITNFALKSLNFCAAAGYNRHMHVKINARSATLYAVYATACVFLNAAVNGTPLAAGLCFSLAICGGNLIAAPLIYIASSAVHLNLTAFVCALFEGAVPVAIAAIYRKTGKKMRAEAIAYFCIALVPFFLLSEVPTPAVLSFISSPYAVRGIMCALLLLFFMFEYRAVYACMFRLGRCLLKEDELLCLAAMFAAAGLGAINLVGEFTYFAFAAFACAVCVRFCASPSAVICGMIIGIAPAICAIEIVPVTAYTVICALGLVFGRAGKFAPCAFVCAASCLYAYSAGYFLQSTALTAIRSVVIVLCCVLAAIPSDAFLRKLKDALNIKKVLDGTAVDRERERTSEKLFKIAEVFREIQNAFESMDDGNGEAQAKRRVFFEVKENCCKRCERRKICEASDVYAGISLLVESGTAKGKVNLIDLPPSVTKNCVHPSELIGALNGMIAEYRRYMTEFENTRAGKKLLADQAQGVSYVIKKCAAEQCRRHSGGGAAALAVKTQLAVHGITCPETYVEEDGDIYAVIIGNADIKAIYAAVFAATGENYTLKDKIEYDGQKRCMVLCRPPKYDAAFGIAAARKSGERASGDTHSVMRINEHRFLMALSDGMGSGEYARRVSTATISLIEAFYRAEMPRGTVLATINKLISFSREERFACIDVCSVDLNTGEAEFIKAGSPAALIVRGSEVKVLESESLPLGILDNLKPAVACERLCDGDMLVFMSDGITSAFNSTPELVAFVSPLRPLNPQSFADKLLAGAIERTGGAADDDMTVLCTRIFSTQTE